VRRPEGSIAPKSMSPAGRAKPDGVGPGVPSRGQGRGANGDSALPGKMPRRRRLAGYRSRRRGSRPVAPCRSRPLRPDANPLISNDRPDRTIGLPRPPAAAAIESSAGVSRLRLHPKAFSPTVGYRTVLNPLSCNPVIWYDGLSQVQYIAGLTRRTPSVPPLQAQYRPDAGQTSQEKGAGFCRHIVSVETPDELDRRAH